MDNYKPSKYKKTVPGTDDNAIQPDMVESFTQLPTVTQEQQERVVQRMAEQKRLKIYRPEA